MCSWVDLAISTFFSPLILSICVCAYLSEDDTIPALPNYSVMWEKMWDSNTDIEYDSGYESDYEEVYSMLVDN